MIYRKKLRILLFGIVSFTGFLMLIPTYYRYQIYDAENYVYWFNLFNLTTENSIAAWWSGGVLLLSGLLAFDGHFLNKGKNESIAEGWKALGILLIVLSADEIGSIHERLLNIEGFSGNILITIFGIFLIYYFVKAIYPLFKNDEERKNSVIILIAFLFFASVAAQEVFEQVTQLKGMGRSLRGVIEEGTEIVGFLTLLFVTSKNTQGIISKDKYAEYPVFEAVKWFANRRFIFWTFVTVILAIITSKLADQSRGHPADWMAATLFIIAAIASIKNYIKYRQKLSLFNWLRFFTYFGASAGAVFIHPEYSVEIDDLTLNIRILIFCFILMVIAIKLIEEKTGLEFKFIIFGLIVTTIIAMTGPIHQNLFLLYLYPQIISLVALKIC